MKNVHRLSLMVLTVLTAAFLVVDLPLMAQMGGQQRRGQQGAPQKQKGAQQGAPKGAGTKIIDPSYRPDPKLTSQQERRVKQLQGQAQSLFRNLQRVVGELQRLPKPGKPGLGSGNDSEWIAGKPNPRGPQQRPGQQPGKPGLGSGNDTEWIAQTGRNDAAFIKFDGLKEQAQQIVNNLEGIGNELKGLGFTKQNFPILQSQGSLVRLKELQQMGEELEKFGVNWALGSWF